VRRDPPDPVSELEDPDQRLVTLAAALAVDMIAALPGVTSPWMTTREAAQYMRVPYETFRKRAASREIPCHPEGGRLYFHRDELDGWRREGSPAE
jgi:excisionase family DNA binding protein